ncbi:MAG: MOSC domain-containing protein [Candidatus Microthrix sp.]|nr:MOSC domain-containing protein [Candidatus Microthrix sp.]MBK6503440.1 MOSC domain-containing protein [Candidatus Microthrix sp.]
MALERLPGDMWLTRVDKSNWAVGDHVADLADVVMSHRLVAETLVETPGTGLGGLPDPPMPPEVFSPNSVATLDRLDDQARRFGRMLHSVDDERWRTSGSAEAEALSLEWVVRKGAHDVIHHLANIARLRHRLGDVVQPVTGLVSSLHASEGGVPKPSIPHADIDAGGVAGDTQAARQYHGRPWQDLCLWSVEVVDAWAAEGHPIFPGAAGENLSIGGLDWSQLRSGLIVEIGSMTARISAPAVPCAKNSRWFSDRDHLRLGHDVSPGRARWYAGVLTPGRIHPGDAVVVCSAG